MKRLFLSVTLVAFAFAMQAGDAKDSKAATQDKPACCAKAKDSAKAKEGSCPFAKDSCCAAKQKDAAAKQQTLQSPKAATQAAK
jgi:hypothetical protein